MNNKFLIGGESNLKEVDASTSIWEANYKSNHNDPFVDIEQKLKLL